MKVSGFTFVRNAIKFDYPVIESIRSIMPICDEVVVAVGNSEDGTLDLIKSIGSPKIKIIETIWDDSLREGGYVLAVETDKAFAAISPDADWAIYVQADEVFHEKELPKIKAGMEKYLADKRVEGLLFRYVNFFGSYDFIADSHKWWKNEIRVIRNDKQIHSWKDAMSFRKNGKLLHVKDLHADCFHYGWVKHPAVMAQKIESFNKMWHDDEWMETKFTKVDEFDYTNIDNLIRYEGTPPKVMAERIKRMNWEFSFDPTELVKASLRIRFLNWLNNSTGWEIGRFKNYKLLKD